MKALIARKKSTERRGVAAVEMAFVFPFFMLLVLGIIEFGRFMMVGQLLTNTAREGARMAISGYYTEAEIQADMEDLMLQSGGVSAADLTISITTASGSTVAAAASKELITVDISASFSDVSYLPMFDKAGGGADDDFSGLRHDASRRISGVSSMRKE